MVVKTFDLVDNETTDGVGFYLKISIYEGYHLYINTSFWLTIVHMAFPPSNVCKCTKYIYIFNKSIGYYNANTLGHFHLANTQPTFYTSKPIIPKPYSLYTILIKNRVYNFEVFNSLIFLYTEMLSKLMQCIIIVNLSNEAINYSKKDSYIFSQIS